MQMNTNKNLPLADQIDALLNRIGAALADKSSTSESLDILLQEAQEAIPATKAEAKRLRERMLDPALPRSEIAAARASADDADIDELRLGDAVQRLNAAWSERNETDEVDALVRRYEVARQLRDEVADQIVKKYPKLHAELVSINLAILSANEAVDRANDNLPDGVPPLQRPEGYVRGFHDHGSYALPVSRQTFRLVQTILPSLTGKKLMAWPRLPLSEEQNLLRNIPTMEKVIERLKR